MAFEFSKALGIPFPESSLFSLSVSPSPSLPLFLFLLLLDQDVKSELLLQGHACLPAYCHLSTMMIMDSKPLKLEGIFPPYFVTSSGLCTPS